MQSNNFLIAQATIFINAPGTRVWEALTKPELIKQYLFGTTVKTDWRVGSPILYEGQWQGKTYQDKGTVTQIEPGKLLVSTYWSSMEGLPDVPESYKTVRYELSSEGFGTRLTVTQDNNTTQEDANHSGENWKSVLDGIKKLLERVNGMKRTMGRSGIEVSALGMGCWAIGGPFWAGNTPNGWGEVDDEESIRAIHQALDLGVTLFDTANVYGAGHSERVLARAFEGHRAEVVIATKFNAVFDETTRQVTGSDTTPAGIRAACEASLRRLNTDYIDLYQFHDNGFPAEQATPVRETLEELVSAGKIRAYGWSTDFPERAEVFALGPHCSAVQMQLNVLDDNPRMIALCEKHNLAALNRGPLAMGLLTDKYTGKVKVAADDVRGEKSPDWMKYFKDGLPNPEWAGKRDAIREILTSKGRSLAQGALAWNWARSEKTLPIPGFRTVAQVQENAGAMQFGPLTPAQMGEINTLLERV
jgi:aryl-alcohol dehydrogenase-like predicted oxidoreductase/uncharacterized protein YndB with AHSA1/START domain